MEFVLLVCVEFCFGQCIVGKGIFFLVECVDVCEGLFVYCGEGCEMEEGQFDDEQSVSQVDDWLIGGCIDLVVQFELCLDVLCCCVEVCCLFIWGFVVVCVGLVLYQLCVVGIVVVCCLLCVLLVDEVGLGKIIEVGMIFVCQFVIGCVICVLVLLLDMLVYQWFVELMCCFNFSFVIYDEECCEVLEQFELGSNLFEDE